MTNPRFAFSVFCHSVVGAIGASSFLFVAVARTAIRGALTQLMGDLHLSTPMPGVSEAFRTAEDILDPYLTFVLWCGALLVLLSVCSLLLDFSTSRASMHSDSAHEAT